ncbi:electron transfer flavoprotein subunit beta/FixA family protein [Paenibacillus sp. SC116]|uniref:electron transfer flavoprotein subunit beta/FixA family protein n=1 Tax=Paenibacillus sp. SC116 TaxID=2968986 RepID=UPI00215A4794|nr:electron transfer flavoprotein subunit beta/FixA family protein [Paenibacillus sp. SC116]MCR8845091.1 electron transfer flavoprotein subunit beta/FixA family protein [Paenibacillus sp. SC116]
MNIIVLAKQTFDTEEKIVIDQGSISEDGVKFVLNPYDEYAVEQAIQLRDEHGGKVTVIAIGPERATEALRTALAMGADEAVLISDEGAVLDEHAVAQILHAYVSKQAFDLILGGNFSVDNGSGQVAIRLAKLLSIPHVGSITKLVIQGGQAEIERDAEGDTEQLTAALPALFTAQQGLNEPRYPSLQGIMKAKRKPLQQLSLSDCDSPTIQPLTARVRVSTPPPRQAGKRLSGTPVEQSQQLIGLLQTEAKLFT